MKRELAAVTYIITVDEDLITSIIREDITANINGNGPSLDMLLNRVEGITDVDYNGHYGAIITISMYAESDIPVIWDRITEIINTYGVTS